MKTGLLIIARVGSTRLERKHLIKAAHKTFIEWLAERYITEFSKEIEKATVEVIIATSTDPDNQAFETVLQSRPVSVFYGPSENIPLRQLKCAEHFKLDNLISIDGDDVLCSVSAARTVLSKLNSGTQAIKTIGLPLGMNLMGYNTRYLSSALKAVHESRTLETGWGRIFPENSVESIRLGNYENDERLRFTLDYKEDAMFFQKIIEGLGNEILSISDEALVKYVIQNKLYSVNEALNETYWNNFNVQKNSEGS